MNATQAAAVLSKRKTMNHREPRGSTAHLRTLQQPVVDTLLASIPGTRTRGWREAVLTELPCTEDEDSEDFRAVVLALTLIPDAYLINKDERELHFFEVEVTSPMSLAKLQAYAVFLTVMDYYRVEFAVFTVNQHGHINQVDLLPHYWDWLKRQQQA